jgi:TRAP-type C4-dicarboxylate transport system substrate-binding protein
MNMKQAGPFGSLVLVLMLIFMVNISTAAPTKVIEFNFASFIPATHLHHGLITNWASEIQKRTNGGVKIHILPGGTLVGPKETYTGVVKGIADIGTTPFNYAPGRFPLMESLDLPIGFPSSVVATRILWEVYNKFKEAQVELGETKVLYLFTTTPNAIWSKKPIRTLEDLKGMEIRCAGDVDLLKLLGAVPVSMPQGETYEALTKGIVKGSVSSLDVLKGYKQAEVINHVTLARLPLTPFYVVMNLNKWKSLPPEIQKIFDDVSEGWMPHTAKTWDQGAEEGLQYARERKVEVITLSKEELARWKLKLKPLIDAHIKELEAKKLPGKAFVAEVIRLNDLYGK